MKNHFKQFILDNGIDQKSVPSYLSYVNKSYEKLLPKCFKKYPTIYDRLYDLNKHSRSMFCEYLISRIKVEISSPSKSFPKRTLNNYKSGVTMLKNFVDSGVYPYNGKKQFTTSFSVSYSNDELIDNFVFRVETQDRIYKSKNCFPCRLFSKVFSTKSIYRSQYESMLNDTFSKTKFLVNTQRDYVLLADVDHLNILGGISIMSHGINYDVFTETFNKIAYNGCIKTNGKILEDISLNHDIPMENIVNREIDRLPELKRLSDAFWNYHASTKLTGAQLTTSFYNNEYPKLSINEAHLLNEIKVIYNFVEFTIMDKKINSALNNKIIPTPPLGNNLNKT